MRVLLQLLVAASIDHRQYTYAEYVNQATLSMHVPSAARLLGPKSSKKTDTSKNICLEKEDKYRTCLARAIDPSNDLEEDTILRDDYNKAAARLAPKSGKGTRQLAEGKSGKTSDSRNGSKSAKSSIGPYTPPFTMQDELLTEGTIYLSMVKEEAEQIMSCDDKVELEEATIEWLNDNLGSKRTFTPLCAFNDGYEFHEEVVINADGKESTIATAAFKMDLVFATKEKFNEQSLASPSGRRRLECSQKQLQECCSADAINDSMNEDEKKEFKQYCKSIGCKKNKCPKKKEKKSIRLLKTSDERFLIEENLLGTNFNDIIREYTDMAPIESGAVLDATSLEDLTICRANAYNIFENDEPVLTCEEYEEANCETNDYLTVETTIATSASSTPAPSTPAPPTPQISHLDQISAPTYLPTYLPTIIPTSTISNSSKVCIPDGSD